MNYRSYFIELYFNQLRQTPLFCAMETTVENSPWHRESNVLVHTDMVVAQYIASAPTFWIKDHLIGALAAAFHDVGKPAAKEERYSEARGTYFAFKGHEPISARLWEDFAVTNWHMFSCCLDFVDIYRTGWVIEHHLPWDIAKPDKRRMLALTVNKMFGTSTTFTDVLMADTQGRIADDADAKCAKSVEWVNAFELFRYSQPDIRLDSARPKLILPIGPSGVGKSTYKRNHHPGVLTFSLDELRMRWYGENYTEAYRMSVEDKEFSNKANQEFFALIKQGKDLYVDNTNLSRKRRAMVIIEARKKGYEIVGVLFPTALSVVVNRQLTRTDKNVPEAAVRQHYMALQYPSYGEVDTVIVVDPEVPTT